MERRTLIRLLIALGIGIPVAVEGATFLGLVGHEIGGDDGSDGTATPTATPVRRPIGVGDELLPETSPVERVTDMTLRATDGGWRFEMVVEVENDLDTAYEFRLGPVTTEGGRTVDGGADTGTMISGATTTITGRWDLPEGDPPDAVAVSAVVPVVGGETPRRYSESVPVARVHVQEG
ncbi:MAG: hypothetical protein ABEJ81_04295 [Haloferacaceae archaeon]